MHLVFEDQTFSFELLRTISYAPYGGADIGECLATASQIREGDFESWYEHWSKRAKRVHALADDALQQGKRVSAREAYLRASNYYRTAGTSPGTCRGTPGHRGHQPRRDVLIRKPAPGWLEHAGRALSLLVVPLKPPPTFFYWKKKKLGYVGSIPILPEHLLTEEKFKVLIVLLAQHLYWYNLSELGDTLSGILPSLTPDYMPGGWLTRWTGNFLWIPVNIGIKLRFHGHFPGICQGRTSQNQQGNHQKSSSLIPLFTP